MGMIWYNPWPGTGADSAVIGTSKEIPGSRIIYKEQDLFGIIPHPQVFVLLGLRVDLATRVREHYPKSVILLQNHSPWIFLESSCHDFEAWLRCYMWCQKDGNAFVAQVDQVEYESACAAFNVDHVILMPNKYPYPIVPVAGGDTIVLAHANRIWKNFANQAIVMRMLQDLGYQVSWYCNEDLQDIASILGPRQPWVPQAEFRKRLSTAALGMCCTFADCFSQVSMDFLSQGIPVLGSFCQWHTPCWRAYPDNIEDMYDMCCDILDDPTSHITAKTLAVEAQHTKDIQISNALNRLGYV